MNYFVIIIGSLFLFITLVSTCIQYKSRKIQSHPINPSLFEFHFYLLHSEKPVFKLEYTHSKLHTYGLDSSNNYIYKELIEQILQKNLDLSINQKNITLQHIDSKQIISNTAQLQKVVNACLSRNIHNIRILVYKWGFNLKRKN